MNCARNLWLRKTEKQQSSVGGTYCVYLLICICDAEQKQFKVKANTDEKETSYEFW